MGWEISPVSAFLYKFLTEENSAVRHKTWVLDKHTTHTNKRKKKGKWIRTNKYTSKVLFFKKGCTEYELFKTNHPELHRKLKEEDEGRKLRSPEQSGYPLSKSFSVLPALYSVPEKKCSGKIDLLNNYLFPPPVLWNQTPEKAMNYIRIFQKSIPSRVHETQVSHAVASPAEQGSLFTKVCLTVPSAFPSARPIDTGLTSYKLRSAPILLAPFAWMPPSP